MGGFEIPRGCLRPGSPRAPCTCLAVMSWRASTVWKPQAQSAASCQRHGEGQILPNDRNHKENALSSDASCLLLLSLSSFVAPCWSRFPRQRAMVLPSSSAREETSVACCRGDSEIERGWVPGGERDFLLEGIIVLPSCHRWRIPDRVEQDAGCPSVYPSSCTRHRMGSARCSCNTRRLMLAQTLRSLRRGGNAPSKQSSSPSAFATLPQWGSPLIPIHEKT